MTVFKNRSLLFASLYIQNVKNVGVNIENVLRKAFLEASHLPGLSSTDWALRSVFLVHKIFGFFRKCSVV